MWSQLTLTILRLGGSGGAPQGGPYLLKVDGVSRLLLVNATDKLNITGTNPSSGYSPTYYILGF
jgi:hypothetical protein